MIIPKGATIRKKLLEIPHDEEAVFLSRENRFLGRVKLKSTDETHDVHVRDPGRLEEILFEGNDVLVKKADNPDRKTDWDLIAGKVEDDWILVNSGFHRQITETILEDEQINPFGKIDSFKAEQQLGESRIDFLLEKNDEKIWLEVKGCTLAVDGTALFPDAPTTRGKRHVEELISVKENGDRAALIFLIFRSDAECFKPYEKRDPAFGETYWKAVESGVEVHPLKMEYDGKELYFVGEIRVCDR